MSTIAPSYRKWPQEFVEGIAIQGHQHHWRQCSHRGSARLASDQGKLAKVVSLLQVNELHFLARLGARSLRDLGELCDAHLARFDEVKDVTLLTLIGGRVDVEWSVGCAHGMRCAGMVYLSDDAFSRCKSNWSQCL